MNNDPSNQSIWIMGCGDIGTRLGLLYQKNNKVANVLVCNKDSADACQLHGFNTTQCNIDDKADKPILKHYLSNMHQAQLFYFIPPSSKGLNDQRLYRLLNQLSMSKSPIKKIVLISTTGVYGDCQGQWIDEKQPVNPIAERAKRRLSAENSLTQWAIHHHIDYVILRVAGIYAQNRLPLERLKKQIPMVKKEESPWMNRIHADDLAHICQQAMETVLPHTLYNACDGSPSTMTDYFDCIANYAHLPTPPKITLEEAKQTLSKGMLSYLNESKRIKNTRLLHDFNIQLKWKSINHCLS